MAANSQRERVLTIVSIIAQYVMEERNPLTETDIVEELLAVGFDEEEIDAAFVWMEDYSLESPSEAAPSMTSSSQRVFTAEEARVLSPEARGFLLRLRTMGLLDDANQEEIIDRAVDTAEDELSLKELKTLTVLILFARYQNDWRREFDCILDDDWSRLYH
ncbi:MAG: hypothetical protein C0617_00710 [Desulfuromonas sp.]|uniref:DUF494 family protein n=1 Tax=Desulfuromonas sp. TaxID=892 RepID=UPI000CA96B6A|nr:DUF494 family protein [Desulfuromonas sp.]PLX86624.1 MAG: hypothetical protein C0617_00710 [Desulfuromonas sp.]